MFNDIKQVLQAIIDAKSNSEISKILEQLGDNGNVGLDSPFGPFNLKWHAFGNNLSNNSTIGLATKPGRSITERLTNAMDAILEERALSSVEKPNTPRIAAERWFGRPVSGPGDGLFKWDYSEGGYDKRIVVILNSSEIENSPTIDVMDCGIGLEPEDFADTILTLQGGNKIQKSYLIGSFGQGGASALGFCEYAVIISRHKDSSKIGFTIIRILELPKPYKDDCYAYLCLEKQDGKNVVPYCESNEELNLYQETPQTRLPGLNHGTIIRHYLYKLGQLNARFSASPGNLYHFLHCSLFDPLLPFRIIDLRDGSKIKNEIVTGSRNRLMKLVEGAGQESSEIETGSELKHYRPMEYVVPLGTADPCIGVEYWVVFNYRKGSNTKKGEIVLRPHSNELFVQKGHPIIATLNGQNQGELTTKLFRDIGLSMVARHCIIHIDTTKVNNKIKRELFSTSREGFKEGPVLECLEQVLTKMLKEDDALYQIEKKLAEKLIEDESKKTKDEVKRNITRLLVEAGYAAKTDGTTDKPGGEEIRIVHPKRTKRTHTPFIPLPTLPFPEVTRFEIVTPKPKMSVRIGDNERILVETDASDEFDIQNRIAIRWNPEYLELAAKAPLRGGKIWWRLRPKQTAKVGEIGEIIVSITKPDGRQLEDKIEYEVLNPLEAKSKESKGYAPDFEVIGIDPYNNCDKWNEVWDDMPDDETNEKLSSVAYKPMNIGGKIYVYYSKIFKPFQEQFEKIKENTSFLDLFISNYETWIGYHGILQINSGNGTDDNEGSDRLLEEERVRVARMQIKQAIEATKLLLAKHSLQNNSIGDD